MPHVIARCLIVFASLYIGFHSTAFAQEPNCGPDSRITEQFDNGAVWDLCWESTVRENLVLSDVYYTPPNGTALRVLSSARLSQLHVAYDDSDVTYNDVTQYGLGGGFLSTLAEQDCPQGELLNILNRPALCIWRGDAQSGHHSANQAAKTQSLHLFSVSQVGAYAYITNWTFHANGAIEPSVGATGALQRSSDDTSEPYGRELAGDQDTLWLSHTHNYYWRLDFDIGESATDDVFSQTRYELTAAGTRAQRVDRFATEQALKINPEEQANWTIHANARADSPAFTIEPIRSGHQFERQEVEAYSDFDFFITVANDCERFASQNARFNPDCLNDVLQFVDGQSIIEEDLVVWNRVSFHHVPRNEDQRHMHTHWDGFLIRPRNVLSGTASLNDVPNSTPTLAPMDIRYTKLGDLVHENVEANDADGDFLLYTATGLPPGVNINSLGHLHGEPTVEGRFTVTITAMDDQNEAARTFFWTINQTGAPERRKSGRVDLSLLILLLVSFMLTRRSNKGQVQTSCL